MERLKEKYRKGSKGRKWKKDREEGESTCAALRRIVPYEGSSLYFVPHL